MKYTTKISQILFILSLLVFGSCDLLNDKNDDCDDTKMEKQEEPIIYIETLFFFETDMFTSDNVEKIVISGSIRKIYCSGKESGNFSFNPTFFVDEDTFDRTSAILVLPQPYQYKFDNTKDKLVLLFHVKMYMVDGTIYESEEIRGNYFYEDLKFDANLMRYILPVISKYYLDWYEVTS